MRPTAVSLIAALIREGDVKPSARGLNGMQLFHDGSRLWIVSVTGDMERDGVILPPEYLPGSK